MHVDVTEIFPDGRATVRPGVDLATAVPDRVMRNRVLSILARGQTATLQDGRASVTITLTRNRPPEAGTAFAIRVRPKAGPGGATALRPNPALSADSTTGSPSRVADRIAAVMRRQAAETGACTVRDLRQAGISYRQIIRHADAARDIIAAAELTA